MRNVLWSLALPVHMDSLVYICICRPFCPGFFALCCIGSISMRMWPQSVSGLQICSSSLFSCKWYGRCNLDYRDGYLSDLWAPLLCCTTSAIFSPYDGYVPLRHRARLRESPCILSVDTAFWPLYVGSLGSFLASPTSPSQCLERFPVILVTLCTDFHSVNSGEDVYHLRNCVTFGCP